MVSAEGDEEEGLLSSPALEVLFLGFRVSPLEIDDCIRLNRARISSLLGDDEDDLPSND